MKTVKIDNKELAKDLSKAAASAEFAADQLRTFGDALRKAGWPKVTYMIPCSNGCDWKKGIPKDKINKPELITICPGCGQRVYIIVE